MIRSRSSAVFGAPRVLPRSALRAPLPRRPRQAIAPAALARVLLAARPALRTLLSQRPGVPGGGASVLLLLLALVSSALAMLRRFLVARTRTCGDCSGFGIHACDLCGSSGMHVWVRLASTALPARTSLARGHLRMRQRHESLLTVRRTGRRRPARRH